MERSQCLPRLTGLTSSRCQDRKPRHSAVPVARCLRARQAHLSALGTLRPFRPRVTRPVPLSLSLSWESLADCERLSGSPVNVPVTRDWDTAEVTQTRHQPIGTGHLSAKPPSPALLSHAALGSRLSCVRSLLHMGLVSLLFLSQCL